jgi:geranylgeranyl diphosphate synthase type II
MNEYVNKINDRLESYIPEEDDLPEKKVYDAVRYSLLAGGKRVRPVIMISVNELFGGDIEDCMPFACALEMIHTYSLIHDDLPAMDNDDYRRGKLTNHKVFGEAIAILAGDALLNKAFEVMIDELSMDQNNSTKIKVMREIAKASGIEGMVAGQVVDMESEGKQINRVLLKYMHERKTGRIIAAAAITGAILAGAGSEDMDKITEYAHNLGLAFQIKDDILSEIGDRNKTGKNTGNDRSKNKSTYVTILGLEEANELLSFITQNAIGALDSYGEKAEFLVELARHLLKREG